MIISSGTTVVVNNEIVTPNGARIMPGTQAMVIGVASSSDPVIYLCETVDGDFEAEEFFCFAENISQVKEVV